MLVQPHRQWCWISLNRAYMCFGHALKLVHALCVPVLASARGHQPSVHIVTAAVTAVAAATGPAAAIYKLLQHYI